MTSLILHYTLVAVACLAAKLYRTLWLQPDWSAVATLDAVVEDLGLHLIVLGSAGAGLWATWTPLARSLVQVTVAALGVLLVLAEAAAVITMHVTGVPLDRYLLAYVFEHVVMVGPLILTEANPVPFGLLLLASAMGIALRIRRALGESQPVVRVALGPGLAMLVAGFVLVALPPFRLPARAARALPVELAAGAWLTPVERMPPQAASPNVIPRSLDVRPLDAAPYRNIVVVALESTGVFATGLGAPGLATTPFLLELRDKSVSFERAYASVTHTSKALVAMLCGIAPYPLMEVREAEPGGIPVRCLPELLAEQGFRTIYFGSHTGSFENRVQLTHNLGFRERVLREDLDGTGFEEANYLSYEDDVLLGPTRDWLEQLGSARFLAFYLTSTAHHDYRTPSRYPLQRFSPDDEQNRYLNAVYYQDQFLRQLFDVYQTSGRAGETLFVVLGDHGEAFGEHGRFLHDAVIHDEGIRIPLLFHARGLESARRQTLVSQIDLPVTLARFVGYRVDGAGGRDLWERGAERVVHAICWYSERCLARISKHRKVVSHFDHLPPEAFEIAMDPRELRNAFGESEGDVETLAELHRWKREVLAGYDAFYALSRTSD